MTGSTCACWCPARSDLPVAKALSRAGYRPLLEAGIRVFEWNGPMLHAKTAVADGSWARIGSSNLNLASWVGNWELDIAVEDAEFAGQMEAMFRADLANATEIVLDLGNVHAAPQSPEPHPARRGSPGRVAAGALGIGSTVGAAITNRRALGPGGGPGHGRGGRRAAGGGGRGDAAAPPGHGAPGPRHALGGRDAAGPRMAASQKGTIKLLSR